MTEEQVSVSYMRHESVFNPEKFGKARVDVVGAGATGSKVVLELAKLGCKNIHVWDFDKIEVHNIPNQLYGLDHVGELKVDALHDLVYYLADVEITVHAEKFVGTEENVGEVIFILTDTMASRKEIWANIKDRISVRLVVETRMGTAEGRVYAVEPHDIHEEYEGTLYDDDVAEVSSCGTSITVGPSATVLAGLAVWAMIEWRGGEKPPNESIFFLKGAKTFLEQQTFQRRETKSDTKEQVSAAP